VLRIHETTKESGALASVFVRVDDGVVSIVDDEGTFALPDGAIRTVMTRYGAPLEPTERVTRIATLDLGDRATLHHVRHLARYDVIARDYLVYETSNREALCALAHNVARALSHLAHAAR
jgi:hypothetical protein